MSSSSSTQQSEHSQSRRMLLKGWWRLSDDASNETKENCLNWQIDAWMHSIKWIDPMNDCFYMDDWSVNQPYTHKPVIHLLGKGQITKLLHCKYHYVSIILVLS